MKRYILTGAPGAGKTAILRALELRGHIVIEEAATDVIALAQARGVLEPHLEAAFIDQITALQKARQIRADALPGDVRIFDRSPICTAALCAFLGRPLSGALAEELERIEAEATYEKTVFFIQNLGFVTPTAARRIGFAESLRFEAAHQEAYVERGYACVSIAPGDVAQRVEQIERSFGTL
jgi:predicted ATPase